MDAKVEPHRARSVTYAIRRNYKKKTAKLKKGGEQLQSESERENKTRGNFLFLVPVHYIFKFGF